MKGQSLLEIIVAVSVVILIAASTVSVVLGSFSSTRLAQEETDASLIAFEGMEAVQSIRNRGWINIVDGQYGLDASTGQWEFSGTSDVDPAGKYTRVITISDVKRDLSGDIVSGNGIVDTETKQITTDVTWDFTPTRQNKVEYVTYLTNWQEAVDPTQTSISVTSCQEYCQGSGYSDGICRKNANQCVTGSEVHQSGGDQFCTNSPATTCCCVN